MLQWWLALLVWITPATAAEATSATGIPIDYLFLIIGALVMLVYGDLRRQQHNMKKDIDKLREDGEKRTKSLIRISTVFRLICQNLRIPWHDNED